MAGARGSVQASAGVGPLTGAARLQARLGGVANGSRRRRGALAGLPPEIRALYLLLGVEVVFLVWQRHAFKAAHGG